MNFMQIWKISLKIKNDSEISVVCLLLLIDVKKCLSEKKSLIK